MPRPPPDHAPVTATTSRSSDGGDQQLLEDGEQATDETTVLDEKSEAEKEKQKNIQKRR